MNKTQYIIGEHHIKIMEALDAVVRGDCRKLIINIAPRYGKTEAVSRMFIAYGLAINPASKFLHLSYSGDLTIENSQAVKDIINCEYYQNVFDTTICHGRDQKAKWETAQGGGMYATSTLGQITGFGAGRVDKEDEQLDKFMALFNPGRFAGAVVIDDPIKPEDALSDNIREAVNRRFETTIRNRVNSRKTPIIIIMQRLHEHDLCGYLMETEPDEWKVLSLPCIQHDEDGNERALWPFKHNLAELYELKRINPFVFETQYMQNPKPMEGLLYRPFKTYEIIPFDKRNRAVNYTDPADTGSDYFVSLCYIESPQGNYITDVMMTKKPAEYTEPTMAKMLIKNDTMLAHIETNGAGRVIMRNVERLSREMGNNKTNFHGFAQTKNKQVRIYSMANEVNNITYFPVDWEQRWPEFANHVKSYRKEGVNAHDDDVDALTGAVEKRGKYSEKTLNALRNHIL